MNDDTGIGGAGDRFPTTRGSAVIGLRSHDPAERGRSFDALVAAYWKPVYKSIRLRWRRSSEDAKDLTQGFFARALEKSFFDSYDPQKARFRTFLRICLDGYIANEDKAARALKRGGDAKILSLDFQTADSELALTSSADPSGRTLEEIFDAEWVRSLFAIAIERLRSECTAHGRDTAFHIFERYDLLETDEDRPRYEDLASAEGISVSAVTNALSLVRRELRRILLETLREITSTDEEFRVEARLLLGRDAR